ncbi:MAG: DUF4397 domain-containing protein [Clostridium sp.]
MYLFRETLPKLKGNLRFLHASPNAPNVDIYADGEPVATNLNFSDISKYNELAPGQHKIQIFKSGTYDTPLLSEEYLVIPGTHFTLAVILLESTIELLTLKDANISGKTEGSFIRFINLSPSAPLLSLSLPTGDVLFNSVEYIETTGYYPLSAGIYNFVVSASNASVFSKYIKNMNLKPGDFTTIYILGQFKTAPKIGYLSVLDGK